MLRFLHPYQWVEWLHRYLVAVSRPIFLTATTERVITLVISLSPILSHRQYKDRNKRLDTKPINCCVLFILYVATTQPGCIAEERYSRNQVHSDRSGISAIQQLFKTLCVGCQWWAALSGTSHGDCRDWYEISLIWTIERRFFVWAV